MNEPAPKTTLARRLLVALCNVCLLGIYSAAVTIFLLTVAAFFGAVNHDCDLATNFRVQYFGSLLLALPFAIKKNRLWLVVFSIGIILNASQIVAYLMPVKSVVVPDSARIKLISANLERGNKDYIATTNCFTKGDADIIAIQELEPEMAKQLLKNLPQYKNYKLVVPPDGGCAGMGILSKWHIKEAEHIVVESGFPIVYAVVETNSGDLLVIDIHPYPPVQEICWKLQGDFFNSVNSIIEAHKGLPVVVLGDANSNPWSCRLKNFIEKAGLTDTELGFGIQGSWPSGLTPLLRIPIDHCFLKGNLAATKRYLGPETGSDHLPVFIELARTKP